jgi:hypothetical protein
MTNNNLGQLGSQVDANQQGANRLYSVWLPFFILH